MERKTNTTADAVVFAGMGNNLKLLLIKRKNPPFENAWALPGGFLERDETPLKGCLRELCEETGLFLTGESALPLASRRKIDRDPRGPTHTYPFLFWLHKGREVQGRDDALCAKWVKLTELEELAFDHGAILCEALGRFWPMMPTGAQVLKAVLLPDFMKTAPVEENARQRGLFYGGSFNPWHSGHEACVDEAPEGLIVVPDCNPWKGQDSIVSAHSLWPRAKKMAKRRCFWHSFKDICEKLKNKKVTIYPGFWGGERGNPTISWLPHTGFQRRGLVMGDDAFLSLHNWQNAAALISILDCLYIVPRGCEQEILLKQKERLLTMNHQLKIYFRKHHPHEQLSSTKMRES